ncbi:MAG: 4'-phosphopantetheinyl transferase superfamily protein [Anaerovoracaceae bacterium]
MDLYFYEGFSNTSTNTVITKAIKSYIKDNNISVKNDIEILRDNMGKPYIEGKPFHFSVTHSGEMALVVISDSNIGIDLQERLPKDIEGLAERFFSEKEAHHIDLWGDDGFLDIWVRKEALTKYLGSSLMRVLSEYDVVDENGIVDSINVNGQKVYFISVNMGYDIKCVIASARKDELCIKGII